jgi:hypothetical protein
MTGYFVFSLVFILDIFLLLSIFFLYKKWESHDTVLSDITEERQIIFGIQKEIREDCLKTESKSNDFLFKIQKIASEIESDIEQSKKTIRDNLESVVIDLSTSFEVPLKELMLRQQSLHSLYNKISEEKDLLSKMLLRAENLVHFFDQKKNYEDVLKDIEQKKYDDARSLMARGFTAQRIVKELGLSLSEVQTIEKLFQLS